jgi:adenosylcobinamide-GDP ribazoletransferase
MNALGHLRLAVSFLTRLPLRTPPAGPEDVGRALAWFPAVGLGLGLAVALLARVLAPHLGATLVAVLLIAVLVAASGALHLDGLADLFDGLGGGRGDRERTLALMRDARIGAHGATALVLVLIAKVVALGAVVEGGDLRVLVVFPALGRWLAALLIVAFPYARAEGLGRAFAQHAGRRELATATLVTAAALAWAGGGAVVAAAPAVLSALVLGAWLSRRLGGLTGDVYGAAIEIGEVVFLISASAWTTGAAGPG